MELSSNFYGVAKGMLLGTALNLVAFGALADEVKPLVDAAWLKSNLGNESVTVLDIRSRLAGGSLEVFEQSHIPGAIYSNYLEDGWRTKNAAGTIGVLPEAAALEALFERLGIEEEDHVVIVGGGNSALDMGSAARVYWTLKIAGHEDVSILDGGFAGWAADKSLPVESGGQDKISPSDYSVELKTAFLATKDDVKSALGKGITLVDNRPEPQFVGKQKHNAAVRFGTIPTAKNVQESLLTEGGQGFFRKSDDLKKLYSEASVSTSDEQINFCNTGHWASLGWFVSHELLGNKSAKMYDGSIVEWSADEQAPMVKYAAD